MPVTKEFSVVERDDDHVWLELREGEKRGLQFAVPLEEEGCGPELNALREGTEITATLESINERNTAWKCVNIEGDDPVVARTADD